MHSASTCWAGARLHRERRGGQRSARWLGETRHRAGQDVLVRSRRLQGPARCDHRGLWRGGPGAAFPYPQDQERVGAHCGRARAYPDCCSDTRAVYQALRRRKEWPSLRPTPLGSRPSIWTLLRVCSKGWRRDVHREPLGVAPVAGDLARLDQHHRDPQRRGASSYASRVPLA